jgi:hypothetical protein
VNKRHPARSGRRKSPSARQGDEPVIPDARGAGDPESIGQCSKSDGFWIVPLRLVQNDGVVILDSIQDLCFAKIFRFDEQRETEVSPPQPSLLVILDSIQDPS